MVRFAIRSPGSGSPLANLGMRIGGNESPMASCRGICSANSHTFISRIPAAAPSSAACSAVGLDAKMAREITSHLPTQYACALAMSTHTPCSPPWKAVCRNLWTEPLTCPRPASFLRRRMIICTPPTLSGVPSSVTHKASPSTPGGRRLRYLHNAFLVCGPKPASLDFPSLPSHTLTRCLLRSISTIRNLAISPSLRPLSKNSNRRARSQAASIFWR